ncbi:MAG: multifunctional oxoglutarate decarboxylase/oxoglutarate dehydrogenase thiamine pyrophosphate-binding subunit/dihydrolipoyllysine-residue succinyltransferase subunit, partial [Acidimicrobiia bacterium]
YMHIQETEQKAWIQERIEGKSAPPAPADRHRILERLVAAESFERFLHTKYVGHKRFGLEGAESLIPMLDALLSAAADSDVEEAVLGMAHRGRLNVLTNVVGKSYAQIFTEFEGRLDPASPLGSGDVKYHLGATGVHQAPSGETIAVTLAANPSHLEAVDPVVEGMTRAKQDTGQDTEHDSVLAVLLHGDAAFAGQGVVAETFNLSALPGYRVGGTVHIVVNNQVGFTTMAEHGRSSVYPTDVAKMVQAPIFHVNGDDPDACVRVVRLAFAFRRAFHKDVVIDMVCYRLHGHNETDEPAFTQPRMYALIEGRPSVRQLYTDALLASGDVSPEQAEAASADLQARLEEAFARTRQTAGDDRKPGEEAGSSPAEQAAALGAPAAVVPTDQMGEAATGVDRETLDLVARALVAIPGGFTPHPKLVRLLGKRSAGLGGEVDWVQAEALAFGTLLLEGIPIRLSGQDTRRGTFSQRHAVLVDYRTESEHVPLAVLGRGRAAFRMYDSLLSEYAALAFDYGYSLGSPSTLVCWEAQFGDFVNGAQIVIDQFIAAGEEKWGQASGIVLLLPHGMEGQGPEHSSGRLERFLALCAGKNLRVAYPTTAAQYFHLLRRQALTEPHRPLVVMTPKRFLRMAATRSSGEEMVSGRFREVLPDPALPAGGRRVLVCSGKVGHELLERRARHGGPDLGVAVVRLEQLYPFPTSELAEALAPHPGAEVVWVQEEPENMGAWSFVRSLLPGVVSSGETGTSGPGAPGQARRIARPPRGSPATGTQSAHDAEQEMLLTTALLGGHSVAPTTDGRSSSRAG